MRRNIKLFKLLEMKRLQDITLDDIKAVMNSKGYEIFTKEGVPNIVGIRNATRDDVKDFYDDICWVWWNDSGIETRHYYTITTHPGHYYLEHPIAGTKGTAILVPGQYIDCWILDMHRGKQFALCQREGQVRVYRDDNKDTVLDYDPKTIDTGFFGIDLHHGSIDDSDVIGPWSAGCQVWRYSKPHAQLMDEFKELSEENNFKRFSYTLLLQEDF
jgi:hypothetical protein